MFEVLKEKIGGALTSMCGTSHEWRKSMTSNVLAVKTPLEAARDKLASVALLDAFQCLWLTIGFLLWARNAGHVDKNWNTCPDYCDVPTELIEPFGFGLTIILGMAIGCKCISTWNCYTLGRAAYKAQSKRQAEDLTWSWRTFNIASSLLGPVTLVYYVVFLVQYLDTSSLLFLFQQCGSLLAIMYDFMCRIQFHQAVAKFIEEVDEGCSGRRENIV